jgi:GalNAc-alpha-(1->4)-GalNAc-alpha-(1->3)-diNAcBac-PP-undecaprenol alpha-1,4-N-acetyl-D-galactosaminyltransferase
MKISFVIHSLDGGGAERVMAGLASRLQRRGHACTLITLDDGQNDRHDVDANVTRMTLDLMKPSVHKWQAVTNNFKRIRRLRQAIRDSQPDVVLSFCDVMNVLTLIATRGLAIPVVISERSDPAKQVIPWPWSSLPQCHEHHRADEYFGADTCSLESS